MSTARDDMKGKRRREEDCALLLDMYPGPEYVSERPGQGTKKFFYLEGHEVISLLNDIFGFMGWSTRLVSTEVDELSETQPGRWTAGICCVVELSVTIEDESGRRKTTSRQDVGYGDVVNARSKMDALGKTRKSAFTDALKRAARQYGKLLGDSMYDKEYLTRIAKVKGDFEKIDFDVKKLYRKPVNEGGELVGPTRKKKRGVELGGAKQVVDARRDGREVENGSKENVVVNGENEDEFGSDVDIDWDEV